MKEIRNTNTELNLEELEQVIGGEKATCWNCMRKFSISGFLKPIKFFWHVMHCKG